MFDVSPEQQAKGLDGLIAKEDIEQGDGPPELKQKRMLEKQGKLSKLLPMKNIRWKWTIMVYDMLYGL